MICYHAIANTCLAIGILAAVALTWWLTHAGIL